MKTIRNQLFCLLAIVYMGGGETYGQLNGKREYYNFIEPYFKGDDYSKFLYTKINLKAHDIKAGIKGASVIIFTLTKNNEIKNIKVVDSTSNDNFNKQFYDAVADYPKSWEVAKLNGKPVDSHIEVSGNLSPIVGGGDFLWGKYKYLPDGLFTNNFYNEGVAFSSENNFKEAIKYFDEVVKVTSGDVDALFNRGICKYKSDDKNGACEDWKKIQNMGKTDADKLILKYCSP